MIRIPQNLSRVLTRTRVFWAAGLLVFLWYHAHAGPDLFWIALMLSLTGECIQLWAASSLEKNRVFLPRGPYKIIRNPMYFGRFFVIGGLLLLDPHAHTLLAYIVLYSIYLKSRVGGEERRLMDIFGMPYSRYLSSIPRFFPVPRRYYQGGGPLFFFRHDLVFRNREHWNLLGLLLFWSLVYVRLYSPNLG